MENLEVISKIHEKKSFNSKVECVGSNPVGGVFMKDDLEDSKLLPAPEFLTPAWKRDVYLFLEHRLHNRNKMATGAVVEATDR